MCFVIDSEQVLQAEEKESVEKNWLKMRERLIDRDITRAKGGGIDLGQEESCIFVQLPAKFHRID